MKVKHSKAPSYASSGRTFLLTLIVSLFWATNAYASVVSSVIFDEQALLEGICDLYRLIGGGFGALIALVAGVGAVVAGAFGIYRAGISFLVVGVGGFMLPALASLFFGTFDCTDISTGFDDTLLRASVCDVFRFVEGAFGALVMTVAGILAIISAAIGAYRAGYSLIVTGVGAFILRALLSLYYGEFNCGALFDARRDKIDQFFAIAPPIPSGP